MPQDHEPQGEGRKRGIWGTRRQQERGASRHKPQALRPTQRKCFDPRSPGFCYRFDISALKAKRHRVTKKIRAFSWGKCQNATLPEQNGSPAKGWRQIPAAKAGTVTAAPSIVAAGSDLPPSCRGPRQEQPRGLGEGRGGAEHTPPATPSSATFPWELLTTLITGKNHSPFPPAERERGCSEWEVTWDFISVIIVII